MIHLKNRTLPDKIQQQLDKYQQEVDNILNYEEKVSEAKRVFEKCKKTKTCQVIRETLDQMCFGARRCCYCEDSYADEVEHIRPKSLYPERVCVWENYLYACGPCNSPKGNQFAVIEPETGRFVNVARQEDEPIVPPLPGSPVFIDPRLENPLNYMILDLLGTFFFVPIAEVGTQEYQRADYTIKILRLNSRGFLVEARHNAFDSYKARLYEYQRKKSLNASHSELERLITSLQKMHHPTVWAEMKRQYTLHPELKTLFQDIPEALTW